MNVDLYSKIEQWLPSGKAQWLTISYVGCIYATLPVMRTILNFLKSNLGKSFSFSVYLFLFAVALGLIFLLFLNQKRNWKHLLCLITILAATAFFLPSIKYPEERVHFLEYAVLGVLLYFALRERIYGRRVLLSIPPIIFLIGLGDELIQELLPNRVYDFRDVLMNFSGGILGELILITFNPALREKRMGH